MFALAGMAYCGIIISGIFIDDAVGTMVPEKPIAERNAQLYGEDWDAPPAIGGISEQYQKVQNEKNGGMPFFSFFSTCGYTISLHRR